MSQFLTSIQTQLDNADSVLKAVEVQSDAMVDGLMQEFTTAEIDIGRDKVAEVMTAFGALLRSRRNALARAESNVVSEMADDKTPMDARDTAAQALRAQLSQTRAFVENHGSTVALRTYGLQRMLPQRPAELATYARESIRLFKAKPRDFDVFGSAVSTTSLITTLEASLTQLEEARTVVGQEKRELELVRDERNTVRSAFEQAYSPIVSIFVSILDLSGRPGLAERLRPTARRVRGDEGIVLDNDSDEPNNPTEGDPIVDEA